MSATNTTNTIGLVGAGTMGSSIAVALATHGFKVKLKDIDESALQQGLDKINYFFERLIEKGLSAQQAAEQKALITPHLSFADFQPVDLVIEAVSENIAIKQSVFEELDKHCPPHSILASNTSSLSISQIGSFTKRAEKVIGLHFFNPAHLMNLVEVIPGLETSDSTVQSAITFGTKLGKLAVRVEECPSFLVNRLLARYLNEALWLLEERQASPEEIDAAACKLLMPIGPLALRDMNGLDIGLAVAQFNYKEYGERFKSPQILAQMVEAKMLGRKSGAGFYQYDQKTKKACGVNPYLLKLLDNLSLAKQIFDPKQLFLPMINEAFMVLQEKICAPQDLDPALKAGLGMRKGPLEYAFELGLPECLKELENLFNKHGERFRPAPLLKRYVWAGKKSL